MNEGIVSSYSTKQFSNMVIEFTTPPDLNIFSKGVDKEISKGIIIQLPEGFEILTNPTT